MPVPDDDRRAVAARLATTAPGAVDALLAAVEDDDDVREVLVDVHGEVVGLTGRRALFVGRDGQVRSFDYGAVSVRLRGEGLGIDALVEGDTLVLDVARATFVRLGVLSQGNPPARATWLPVRAPGARPEPTPEPQPDPQARLGPAAAPPEPPSGPVPATPMPPPGWHPDPSGRHWWRWWDGRGWTEHVADGGAPFVDPLPPRPSTGA